MKYKQKIKKIDLIVFLIMTSMHNFFYLVPYQFGAFSFNDVLFCLSVGLFFVYLLNDSELLKFGHFNNIILFVPVLIILSSVGAYYNYAQSIISGLLTQRYWLATILLYFVLGYFVKKCQLTYDSFVKILNTIVIIELILYFLQFVLADKILFLQANSNQRYGSIRLYCNTNYMVLAALIALEKALKKEKLLYNTLLTIAVIAYFLIIHKGRGAFIGLMIALSIVILLSHVKLRIKILFIAIAIGVGVFVLLPSDVAQDLVNVLFNGERDGTYEVRLNSQSFYISTWLKNPVSFIVGYGYGNSTQLNSLAATGALSGYLYADNGIYGFISCYGLIGLLWYIAFLIKRFIIWWQNKKLFSVAVISLLVMHLVQYATNIYYFYTNFSFELVIVMIFIELNCLYKRERS